MIVDAFLAPSGNSKSCSAVMALSHPECSTIVIVWADVVGSGEEIVTSTGRYPYAFTQCVSTYSCMPNRREAGRFAGMAIMSPFGCTTGCGMALAGTGGG